jgi:eukaryotic-like serine/threonine-protein kinase
MNTSENFQALKPHYFAWLESPEQDRAGLLSQLAASLAPALFQALQSLIAHTQIMPNAAANSLGQSERIGALYGPFRISTRIGGGGMGEVYLADRIEGGFSQQVALKLVRAAFASPALIQRFNREREILARLSHPNIAGLVDGGLTDGLPWFAMAYVDGVSLSEYVRAHQPSIPQKLALALQMADALTEAHRKLVIHRDLKPGNILVTQSGVVKLLDFGIGKILDSSDAAQTLTGPTPMTIRYASPEQLAGEATSISTDIYQLGLVLSELLLGAPIRAESELANARSLAVDVRAVLRQALAALPTQRYASASEFAGDLRRLLAREPVQAMPARLGYRMQRFITRNRALSLSLVFAMLALAAGVASSLWQATQARQNADALLRLLNVAAPQTFVGKEPPLVDYLVNSAKQLETDLANQPEFLARALTEIGNGLINLSREQAAQQVLQKAHAAALRAGFDTEHELPILRLIAHTMEPPSPLSSAQTLSKQIALKLAESPSGAGLNALATITNALSKQGDTASVQSNLARISTLRTSIKLAAQDLENLLRQIGKIAQRERGFEQAMSYFSEACQLYQAQAALFSPMRIAEGYTLLAGAALNSGDLVKAEQAWKRAQPEFVRSYDKNDEPMQEFLILGEEIRAAKAAKLVE